MTNNINTNSLLFTIIAFVFVGNTTHGFQVQHDSCLANLLNIEEHKIDLDSGVVLLPVTVFGQTYRFILDTGSNVMVYDTKFEPQLIAVDQEANVSTLADTAISRRLYKPPLAHLGTYNVQTKEYVICADLSLVRTELGDDIYGIIGMPFLKDHGIFIDSDSNKFYIFDVQKNACINSRAFSYRTPISVDKLKPSITVEFASLGKRRLTIDTGSATGVTVNHSDFETLLNNNEIQIGESVTFGTISKTVTQRAGTLKKIRFDRFDSLGIQITENTKSQSIGLDTLKRLNFMLDFQNNTAYFNERHDLSYLKAFSELGFEIIHRNGKWVVVSVDSGGRAFKSGIRNGDVIVGIKNRDITELDINAICKMLLEMQSINLLIARESKYYYKNIR